MTPEISIIVPVYNVEKYLRRCVDSILAQTFRNFECILIDDGSPDNCPAICDEYAAKDPRIQVIHQKNAGVSAARNAGLAAARGNWIGFVDSDDWVEPETYETAYNTAKEKNADLVQWNISYEKDGKKIRSPKFWKEGDFSVADDATYFCGSVCHKLIFSKLICDNNITFPQNIKFTEDKLFAFQCYIAATHCYQIENVLYHYEENKDSAMHNLSKDMIEDEITVDGIMQNTVLSKGLEKTEWKNVIIKSKKETKSNTILGLKEPDFNLYHSLYPEHSRTMISTNRKSKLVFLLLYFHFDFTAAILITIYKFISRSMKKPSKSDY